MIVQALYVPLYIAIVCKAVSDPLCNYHALQYRCAYPVYSREQKDLRKIMVNPFSLISLPGYFIECLYPQDFILYQLRIQTSVFTILLISCKVMCQPCSECMICINYCLVAILSTLAHVLVVFLWVKANVVPRVQSLFPFFFVGTEKGSGSICCLLL